MQAKYVADARRYPLLSKDEEENLVQQMIGGSKEAFNKLVTGNLRLAMLLAAQYKRSGVPMEDLVQAANVGLMRGVERYKPDHGAKLTYYAAYWIHEQIRKLVMAEKSLIKIGTTTNQKKLFSNMYKKIDDICNFDKEQLAIDLNVSVKEIEEMCVRLRSEVRLDNQLFGDSKAQRVVDTLATDIPSPEEALLEDDQANVLEQLFDKAGLTDIEALVVKSRNSDDAKTIATLTEELKLSRSAVKNAYNRAIKKLRDAAEELGIEPEDVL
jgi:RNA polymerase sigma-32 factor